MSKVYIASMNLRGTWAEKPDVKSLSVVNVTSAQGKSNSNRLAFSPMTPIEGGYKEFWNFESYWQSGKVVEDIPEAVTKKWWLNCKEAKRRYPKSKGKRVLHASFGEDDLQNLGYVESRKKVYVPEYHELVKDREPIAKLKQILADGGNIVIYDFDGPRDAEGGVMCLEFDEALFRDKLEHTQHPFGHGYIVAAILKGLDVYNILNE